MSKLNKWFLSLEVGCQDILGEDKWALAESAFAAGERLAAEKAEAAAPDLLSALNYLLEQTVDMNLAQGFNLTKGEDEARNQALDAIAKATRGN